ncbi:hypothetical protein, partial [Symbiobacterium terraclitae]|uniref:hypothetical protein n=1 Tax=Symbiobacterium terraclitae TaxID=557451 RepID=UPI0035B563B3
VEVALPQGTATAAWHPLPVPARWAVDVLPHPGGVTCLVRGDGGLRRVALPGAVGVPAAVTVAGTVVPGAALNRLWVEAVNA